MDAVGFGEEEVGAVVLEAGVPVLELGEGDGELVFDFAAVVVGFDDVVSCWG